MRIRHMMTIMLMAALLAGCARGGGTKAPPAQDTDTAGQPAGTGSQGGGGQR